MVTHSLPLQTAANPAVLGSYSDDHIASVAAKSYSRVAAAWQLNNAEAAELIAVSTRTWARIKTGAWSGTLKRDQLLRISALIGIYKSLHLYFSKDIANRWVRLVNSGPLFNGHPPSSVMISGGLPSILETRTYIDALRGGA